MRYQRYHHAGLENFHLSPCCLNIMSLNFDVADAVMSSNDSFTAVKEAMEAGAQDFLIKPIRYFNSIFGLILVQELCWM